MKKPIKFEDSQQALSKLEKQGNVVPYTTLEYALYFEKPMSEQEIIDFLHKLGFRKEPYMYVLERDGGRIEIHGSTLFPRMGLRIEELGKNDQIKSYNLIKETILEFCKNFDVVIKAYLDKKTLSIEEFKNDVEKWKNSYSMLKSRGASKNEN